MKGERGITLISLIVYVIVMTFVIAGVSAITASFYSNLKEFDTESEDAVSYAKFNMYFINDIKRKDIEISEAGEDYIILAYEIDGEGTEVIGGITVEGGERVQVQYVVQNKILYRNKVKICENVNEVLFTADEANNTIRIDMKIGDYKRTTTYKLENVDTIDTSGPTI